MKTRVIAWFSGGITSASACLWAVQMFKNVEVVYIDTQNEDEDTYRFMGDCQKLYGQGIRILTRIGREYSSIAAVWEKYLSLNTAHGAICSTVLKREMREAYQNLETDYAQIFGFDSNEKERHKNMVRNYPEINVISPLVQMKMSKTDCIRQFNKFGIEIPRAYKLGFRNNNCLNTGCVRGGIGYWQKMKEIKPEAFAAMAAREHDFTNKKGEPVTILKDRTNGQVNRLFLLPHPDYPDIKDISMSKGREPEALVECTGFCSTE